MLLPIRSFAVRATKSKSAYDNYVVWGNGDGKWRELGPSNLPSIRYLRYTIPRFDVNRLLLPPPSPNMRYTKWKLGELVRGVKLRFSAIESRSIMYSGSLSNYLPRVYYFTYFIYLRVKGGQDNE